MHGQATTVHAVKCPLLKWSRFRSGTVSRSQTWPALFFRAISEGHDEAKWNVNAGDQGKTVIEALDALVRRVLPLPALPWFSTVIDPLSKTMTTRSCWISDVPCWYLRVESSACRITSAASQLMNMAIFRSEHSFATARNLRATWMRRETGSDCRCS